MCEDLIYKVLVSEFKLKLIDIAFLILHQLDQPGLRG